MSKSIYIVPKRNLLAYVSVNGVTKPVEDQTVWIVDKIENGYIFGTSYTTLDGVPSSKTSFIGSIASNNNVMINFNGIIGQGSYDKFTNVFTMQMNNDVLYHWASMIYINKKSKYFKKLPGVKISVPEFIKLFD